MALIIYSTRDLIPVTLEERDLIEEYVELLKANTPITVFGRPPTYPCFPIIVVGSDEVGKKALLDRHFRYEFEQFLAAYDPTLDDTSPYQGISLINGHRCGMRWKQANVSDSLNRSYSLLLLKSLAIECRVALLIYDISNRSSFEHLSKFYDLVQPELSTLEPPNENVTKRKPIVVVANKIDLPTADWVVSQSEGQEFASKIGATFFEASAKDMTGVTTAMNIVMT